MANTISYGNTVIKTITSAGTFTLPTAGKIMQYDLVLHLDEDHKFSVKMSWGGRVRLHTRSMTRTIRSAGLYMTDDISVEVIDLASNSEITVTAYTGDSDTPTVLHPTTGTTVEFTAQSLPGKFFSHWLCNGRPCSYQNLLSFTPTKSDVPQADDYVFQAVFSDTAPQPTGCSTIFTTFYASDNKARFLAYNVPPTSGLVVRCGLLASPAISFDPSLDELTESNAAYVKSVSGTVGTNHQSNYSWAKSSVQLGDVWYVRGYIVWTENGVEQPEVYSPLVRFVAE